VQQERALAILPEARVRSEQSSGKIKQPVVLSGLQGKAKCGKEAFLVTAFLVIFVATKVTGPPAAKSGYTPSKAALYSRTREEIINAVNYFFKALMSSLRSVVHASQ
jgi:hypothetical protein